MTLPGLAIVSVSPATSTLCPPSRSASVVHPALLLSPRYAELTSATSAGASAVVAGRVIKPIVMQRIVDSSDGASSINTAASGVALYHGRRHVIIGPHFALTRGTRVSCQIT